ncbi:MAG: desulfoferrodoxin family protein [Eggerthia catenaformis]|uniref:desulfoferrodoxin family protein n=1 Tax=Eggerthia catenaformis TaxID=31973 RepID=UPI00047C38B3|nr:desulfoferrodoxin family protein [Eggerthia catenaformis]OUC52293.1 desulfoferrodoxin Dfx [Eggerthia catenaformis]
MEFYRCKECGSIVVKVTEGKGAHCGENLEKLTANTVDAATEKHVPEISVEGHLVTVKVGSVEHPMLEAHYIEFIALETTAGVHYKTLKPGEAPIAKFVLDEGEEVLHAYEFCNLHGLWMA